MKKVTMFVSLLFMLVFPTFALAQEVAPPQSPPAVVSPSVSPVAAAFWQYVFPFLLTAVSGALTWALALLTKWLREKASAVNQSATQARFTHAMDALWGVVANTVAELNVSMKSKLPSYLADGKISPEEAADLKAAALEIVKTKLGPNLLGVVKAELGGVFETVVGGMIEKAVVATKDTTISGDGVTSLNKAGASPSGGVPFNP